MFFGNHSMELETQASNKDVFLKALADLGVTTFVVEYSGGGDSGDVTETSATPEGVMAQVVATKVIERAVSGEYVDGKWHYSFREKDISLDEALRNFAMQWVNLNHGGWENNDGGTGTFTVDVDTGEFTLDHREYYTESTSYAYSL